MLKTTLKIILAFVIAFFFLTLFCFFYYNMPVHYTSEDGVTDYVWQSNKFLSICTEGFSTGRTNNEGYSNSYDYEEGMKIDVLIMGSSQMEAFNVRPNESTAYLLGQMLDEKVYNIGVSDHFFLTCCQNLKAASEKYNPDSIVIETGTVSFFDNDVQLVLEGNYPEKESRSVGLLGVLQKNPFLRCAFTQYKHSVQNTSGESQPEAPALSTSLQKLTNKMAEDSGRADVVILYQPSRGQCEDTSEIETACRNSGIVFLDMSDRFKREYEENHVYPHGFSNTSVGTGHLNKYGHKMIAEELCNLLREAK